MYCRVIEAACSGLEAAQEVGPNINKVLPWRAMKAGVDGLGHRY